MGVAVLRGLSRKTEIWRRRERESDRRNKRRFWGEMEKEKRERW